MTQVHLQFTVPFLTTFYMPYHNPMLPPEAAAQLKLGMERSPEGEPK